jgi:hypothetical protein
MTETKGYKPFAKRYTVKTISYYGPGAESWTVWDRAQCCEVGWPSLDRKEIVRQAREANQAAVA